MKTFIREIDGFYNNNVNFSDTDSLCNEEKYWDVVDKTKLVGEELCRGKIDYKSGGVFYSLFLIAPNLKYCLTIGKFGIVQEHKTFTEFNDSERLLDGSHCFKMIEVKKTSALLPKRWKKLFNIGKVIPTKTRFCNESNDKRQCQKSSNQVNEKKEFGANLNVLKGQISDEFGHMLPYLKQ